MSPENNDEMRPEYDMSGGVRGQFFAHAQRWAGITTAVGIDMNILTSTGDESAPKLVLIVSHHPTHISPLELRTESVGRIAPEVSAASAHAG